MGKAKGHQMIEAQVGSQSAEEVQPRPNVEERTADVATNEPEQRVNIAEEFYLEVTERPDVREVLRRLANM